MGKYTSTAGALVVLALLGACRSGGPVADGGPDDPFFSGADSDDGAQTSGIGGPGSIPMTEAERREAARRADVMSDIVVYFDFDQSEIRPEFNQMLAEHAGFLADYPDAGVRLEGHADETGSREYNIGLGERRAQAVRRVLMLQGVSPGQLSTVSYGEERPAALGSDEESYSLNRRVELVYE